MKSEALRKAIQQAIKDTSYTLKGTAPEYDSPKFKKALAQSRKEDLRRAQEIIMKQVEDLLQKEVDMIGEFIHENAVSVFPHGVLPFDYMYRGKPMTQEEFQTMYKKMAR